MQIEICRLSKQSQRPLSAGKCRFLVMGMGTQFYHLLFISFAVGTFVLIMVAFLTGDEDSTSYLEIFSGYGE